MKNKYNAKKITVDGNTFDSLKEAIRFQELKILQRAGEIKELQLQPSFDLMVNDQLVCKYIADFSYLAKGAEISPGSHREARIVEDVKGMKSGAAWQIFRIKAKLMLALHNIDVQVV